MLRMIIISIILAKINVMKTTFIKINDGYIKKYIIAIFIHKKRKNPTKLYKIKVFPLDISINKGIINLI
jgi:hypothetical protein